MFTDEMYDFICDIIKRYEDEYEDVESVGDQSVLDVLKTKISTCDEILDALCCME